MGIDGQGLEGIRQKSNSVLFRAMPGNIGEEALYHGESLGVLYSYSPMTFYLRVFWGYHLLTGVGGAFKIQSPEGY